MAWEIIQDTFSPPNEARINSYPFSERVFQLELMDSESGCEIILKYRPVVHSPIDRCTLDVICPTFIGFDEAADFIDFHLQSETRAYWYAAPHEDLYLISSHLSPLLAEQLPEALALLRHKSINLPDAYIELIHSYAKIRKSTEREEAYYEELQEKELQFSHLKASAFSILQELDSQYEVASQDMPNLADFSNALMALGHQCLERGLLSQALEVFQTQLFRVNSIYAPMATWLSIKLEAQQMAEKNLYPSEKKSNLRALLSQCYLDNRQIPIPSECAVYSLQQLAQYANVSIDTPILKSQKEFNDYGLETLLKISDACLAAKTDNEHLRARVCELEQRLAQLDTNAASTWATSPRALLLSQSLDKEVQAPAYKSSTSSSISAIRPKP